MLTSERQMAQSARIAAGVGSGPYALSELQAAVVVAQLPWLDRVNAECRQYFTEVAQGLASSSVLAPFASDNCQAAFYQAGFVLGAGSQHGSREAGDLLGEPRASAMRLSGISANHSWQAETVGSLRDLGVSAGVGFAGFHRRSNRRCRWLTPMRHTASVAERTLTVHYLEALAGRITPRRLAKILREGDLGHPPSHVLDP